MYKILLVDDEPIVLKGIRLIIEQSNMNFDEIMTAGDGEEALEIIKETLPDIIITDIRMPKVDGMELCRRIHKKLPDVQLAILSGYDEFDYAKMAFKYNVNDYLLKPVVRSELVGLLKDMSLILDKMKKDNYTSHDAMERVADKFSEALWTKDSVGIYEGKRLINSLFDNAEDSGIFQVFNDVVNMILSRLSIKLGYGFKMPIGSKDDMIEQGQTRFVENELDRIAIELNHRIQNTEYNLIEMAKAYIDKNYYKQFTLQDLAVQTGFSANYFSQLFKKNIGKSFVQYRLQIRLEQALGFMRRPDMTITDAAMRAGFNDLTYFTKKFKTKYGVTPQKFMKAYRNND